MQPDIMEDPHVESVRILRDDPIQR